MSAPTLWSLSYSPWSEKAVFALAVRRVAYARRSYRPLLDEPALRRLRPPGKPLSVPILVLPDRVVCDAIDIARWADTQGEGPSLFPPGQEAAISAWDAVAERGMAAGRVISLHRVLSDREALLELVPRSLRWLGPGARALAAYGVRRTLRKYGSASTAVDAARRDAVAALEEVRAGLAAHGGESGYLLGAFSFADIAAAQMLVFVAPSAFGPRIGAASRRAFADPELAARFADLVRWRDALYTRHRPR